MLVYCPNKYKTQKICDEAVDECLRAVKFVPDWFVTNKKIKKLLTALYADYNIFYFKEDLGDVIFSCNEMGILSVNLDDINYGEGDPKNIIINYYS